MAGNATDNAHSLFKVIETGGPALAAEVVVADSPNRKAFNSPVTCAIPGPAELERLAEQMSAYARIR